MNFSLHDLVPCFYGRDVSDEGGQQDPTEFIETLFFAIDGQAYTDKARKQIATRVIFRTHLRDKALLWYRGLSPKTRASWQLLEAAFLSRFTLVARKEFDQTRFLNLVVNFRQRGRSIIDYTREGDQLNAECPENFRDVLGHQFIAGLDDKRKVDLVQVYLGAQKSAVSYTHAKQAVEKAYQRFGEPSPFDNLRSQPSSPPPTSVQSELVALLQALRIPLPTPLRDNLPHRSNYGSTDMRDQNWAIDELQGGPRQCSRGPATVSGLPPPQSSLAVVASGGVERQKQGYQKMNKIGVANVVILKRPAVKESHELAPAKVSRPQDFCSTSQLKTPVTRSVERSLTQQVSRNLEPLNEKTTQPLFLPLPLPDDDIDNDDSARVNSQEVASPQTDFPDTKESMPIKKKEDRLPQPKGQLVRAIVPSWCTERRPTRPNTTGIAAVAANFWFPPALKLVLHKEKEGHDQLPSKRWKYKVLDWGPGAKTIWGRSILKILPLMNSQLVRLDGFSPAKIMLGLVLKWKAMDGHVQEIRPDSQRREQSPFTLCFLTFS